MTTPADADRRTTSKAGQVRRIVLVGFMAAGKSTIAPRLAHALDWRVFDVDLELSRQTGRTIAGIFQDLGEPHFRRLEAELTAALCSGDRVVIAAGGGWITSPASESVIKDAETRVIWLRVSPDEAVRRAEQDPVERPLLAGENAIEKARRLLAEREPLYAAADVTIDADGRDADAVLDDILTWLKASTS